MRFCTTQSGSTIIAILLIMTAIVIIATNILRSSSFMHDISLRRSQNEQVFRATEGLLNFGIALAINHYQAFTLSKKKDWLFEIGSWPPHSKKLHEGTLHIQISGSDFTICAQLSKMNQPLYTLSCTLHTQQNAELSGQKELVKKQFVISNWKIIKADSDKFPSPAF